MKQKYGSAEGTRNYRKCEFFKTRPLSGLLSVFLGKRNGVEAKDRKESSLQFADDFTGISCTPTGLQELR